MKHRRTMRQRYALKHGILKEFLAEFLGTFILVLFGVGSVAQTVLSRNTMGETLTIHIGFSVGLMMAVYVAGGVSGAHVNPAVSLAMVILGKLKFYKFPVYVVAQFLSVLSLELLQCLALLRLYVAPEVKDAVDFPLSNKDAFMDFTNGILSVTGINATGHIFASYPAQSLTILGGLIDHAVGTGMLVLCILAIIDGKNIAPLGAWSHWCIGLIHHGYRGIHGAELGVAGDGTVVRLLRARDGGKPHGKRCGAIQETVEESFRALSKWTWARRGGARPGHLNPDDATGYQSDVEAPPVPGFPPPHITLTRAKPPLFTLRLFGVAFVC
ncbi:hypothetical protein J4Q44_G00208280 [Coregonus suidteri]|uniref:Uncharacterized protein n=1 Tax=Coregonus suidteri TaxID=861788 RepID=A0AAN8QMT1_9TELE